MKRILLLLLFALSMSFTVSAQSSEGFDGVTLTGGYSFSSSPRVINGWTFSLLTASGSNADYDASSPNSIDATNFTYAGGGTDLANGSTDKALGFIGWYGEAKTAVIKTTNGNNFKLNSFTIDNSAGSSALVVRGYVDGNSTPVVSQNFTAGVGSTPVILSGASWSGIDEFRIELQNGDADVWFYIDDISVTASPSITGQPSNSTICAGANTSFGIAASNATTYKWQVSINGGASFSDLSNVAPYSGVSTSTLTITGATAAMSSYQYKCIVSGSVAPDATSNAATLIVNSGPSFTAQPSASTICAGGNTTFLATASNATGYQWQVDQGAGFSNVSNGAPYSGATTSTLTITGATAGLNGYIYRVVATGACTPSATSNSAALTINSAPAITTQPSASTICAGANTSFSATASNATGYQWQVDQGAGFSNVSNGAPYSGATTSTLTITGATAGLNGYIYRVVATGACTPNATSNSAALTINSAPAITAQPSASTICAGANTSFTATASNATGYQWQVDQGAGFSNVSNGAPYSGATTATLTITGATAGLNGYIYRVLVTGTCTPAATSNSAALTINSAPAITAQPSPSTICAGANTSFSATASNATGYQWQVDQGAGFSNVSNGAPYSGATTATLTITGATAGLNGYIYRVVATGVCTPNATSNSAALTINAAPSIASSPSDQMVAVGGNVSYSVSANNATGYQWQVDQGSGFSNLNNGALYSGATTGTLNITGVTAGMHGYLYRCVVSGSCTPIATSSSASLTVTTTVASITRASLDPTNADAVVYNVIFNNPISGLSTSNFSLSTTGTATGSVSSISGSSGNSFVVTVNSITGKGTLGLILNNSTGILPMVTGLPFNSGEIYNIDRVPPAIPSGLTAVSGDTKNTISWNANSEVDFSSYELYGGTSANPTILLSSIPTGTTTYVHSGLTNGVTYYYRIASKDALGNESNASSEVTATPKANQILTFTAVATNIYGDADFDPGATSDNLTIPITYASSDNSIATIVANKVHIIKAGTVTIVANQAGNAAFNAATPVQQTLTITPLAVTVTADANQAKVYGAADPAAYTYTSAPAAGSLLANGQSVSFSGALSRAAGESVGTTYAITQGSLANSNYTIIYAGANFAITPLAVTVTVDANQAKVYGAADPAAYTYTSAPAAGSLLANGQSVSFSGALSRAAGENVGTSYAITQGSLTNSNYTITYTGANFAITPLAVTVTVDANQAKVYGAADPAAYTYTSAPAAGSLLANGQSVSFSGALSRAVGENVGTTYAITQGSLANSNYTITYTGANFAITPLAVTVTANAGQAKVYGSADPAAYTYTSAPAAGSLLANGQSVSFSGALSRAAGENVGTAYAITQGSLTNSNYTIAYTGANFAITPLTVTVTANAGQSKVYGAADPAIYTYTSAPAEGSLLANGQSVSFSGALSRAAGENVGSSYAITQGSLANSNYTIIYAGANFAITPLAVTVTANAGQAKVYGSADPAIYTYTSAPAEGSLLANGQSVSFSGALSRAAGENVGSSYAITQGSLANSNYTITYTGANFAITPLAVTVTANAGQAKVYGAADPAAYTYTSAPAAGSPLANGQSVSFSGALSRAAGENVGTTYAITQGSLANSNYTITYTGANFAITPLAVTVTADANQAKVYGAADPAAYTYTSAPAAGSLLANGQSVSFSGALSRAAGENVGSSYAITQGSLANSNYTINYTGANFAITPLTVTVTADANQAKAYGSADPAAYTYTSAPAAGSLLANGQSVSFSGALSRAAGENVGSSYAISQGSLANSNYTITYTGANFAITPLVVTVTANAGQAKVYGAADPAAYTYTSVPAAGSPLANGQSVSFSGALSRAAGENAGTTYAITQGSLANSNYTINYTGANFAITPKSVTVTANAQSKVYGEADPGLTYVATGLINGDVLTGSLSRSPGNNVGVYAINKGTLSAGNNYLINFQSADLTIVKAVLTITADNKQTCQGSLPNLTINYNGFKNGDGANNLQKVPTVNTVANSASMAGNYALTPAGAVSNNYTFVYVNGVLTINPLPQLSISSNKPQRISKGDFVELKAQGSASVFEWQEAPGIQSGKNTAVLTVRPMQTTAYVVRGYNENGCFTEQSYTVEVVEDFVLNATNVITPNADGRNDKWVVRNIESYPNNLVKIFDKAGRIIYTKAGYLNQWDGTFNDQPLQEGTYYYIIDLGNGSKLYKGYITVVRD